MMMMMFILVNMLVATLHEKKTNLKLFLFLFQCDENTSELLEHRSLTSSAATIDVAL